MLKLNFFEQKILLYVSIILLIYNISLKANLIHIATDNYKVYDDLTEFIVKPNSLLDKHSLFIWSVPVIGLFFVDKDWTNYYKDNIEPQVKIQSFHLSDKGLFDALKIIHQINESYFHNQDLKKLNFCLAEAIIDGFFVSQSLKHVFGRARPFITDNPHEWFNLHFEPEGQYTSMPSTHATVYFATSTVLGKYLNNEFLGDAIGVIGYFSLVGHNHWVSDMWMGYLLGKAIGSYVWKKRQNLDLSDQWFVYPTFYPNEGTYFPVIGFWKYI